MISILQVVFAALLAWGIYLFGLIVYRLYLHPLASFPGPKYAAISRWHEFYYDVYLRGKFIFHLEELHRQYGPIVRITPDEVHIKDSDFYEILFSKSGRLDRWDWASGRFANETSAFTTGPDALHRVRRKALDPFFSRQRILGVQDIIREKVKILLQVIMQYKENGKPFNLKLGYSAYAEDVVMQYTFAQDYNSLQKPDWEPILHHSFDAVTQSGNTSLQFPWIPKILMALPESWVVKLEPLYAMIFRLQADLSKQIRIVKKQGLDPYVGDSSKFSVFSELVRGDLPPAEKADLRLRDEAQLIVGAGLLTTAWALATGTFHILNNPGVHSRLRSELCSAIPEYDQAHPSAALEWTHLEKLPYLSGVVKESVRMSNPVSTRLTRLSWNPIRYGEWTIPPRTPISMSQPFINYDDEVFPDANTFRPERWMGNPKAKNGSSLERYFVAFGKGSKSCLGINLAHAELFMAYAAVFRFCDLELFETDRSDVEMAHDYFLPFPKMDSKGIRVKAK